jgi:hypothetical protein
MPEYRKLSGERAVTVVGLVAGGAGIAILWASGVEFPVAIPPGLVILLVGTLFVGLAPWRWATGVGAFLRLLVTLGFLVSGGIPNLVDGDGSTFFGTPNLIGRDTFGPLSIRESQYTRSPRLRFRALLTENGDPRVQLHRA